MIGRGIVLRNSARATGESQEGESGKARGTDADGEVSSQYGDGIGGRNSAFCTGLRGKRLREEDCCAQRGTDGLTETVGSGAVADGETLEMARAIDSIRPMCSAGATPSHCLRAWTKSSSQDRQEIICATCDFNCRALRKRLNTEIIETQSSQRRK